MSFRALVVDDEEDGRKMLAQALTAADFEVRALADGFAALEEFAEFDPHILVTDHWMAGMVGTELVSRVREFSQLPIIVISAQGTIALCDEAHRQGAQRFLEYGRSLEEIGVVALDLIQAEQPQAGASVTLQGLLERREIDERTRYETLMVAYQGNRSRIARHLGVDRSTVIYHLKKHGLA